MNADIILNQEQCLTTILDYIEQKKPGSFIRKGDGENVMLYYGINPLVKAKRYREKLRHFNISRHNRQFQFLMRSELIKACAHASILGVAPLNHRHKFWALEQDILTYYNWHTQCLGDMNFHFGFIKRPGQDSLMNPLAEKIIMNKRVGVISHLNVAPFLDKFQSEIISTIAIPKQKSRFKKINRQKYDSIKERIQHHCATTDIWLVAAGMYAKPLCQYIAEQNGIAIDIGSSIDTWNNQYHSRGHLRKLVKLNNINVKSWNGFNWH